MLRFLIKRGLQALAVLAVVSMISFVMLKLIPGDAARAILGPQASPEDVERYRHAAGLDENIAVQYFKYVGRLVHGDLGMSVTYNVPVTELIGERLPKSLLLTTLAIGLATLIGVPMGVLQAARRNRAIDFLLTGVSFLFYATPVFLLGLLAIYLFAVTWPLLPPVGPSGSSLGEVLTEPVALILPVGTLTLLVLALFSRYVRASVIDNLAEDYVRTARAKGLSHRRVLFGHVLRNSLSPMVTMLGLVLPGLLAGTMIIEYVFNYPGMGLLFYNAVLEYDYAPMMATILIVSLATVLASLASDIAYALLDPRVRGGLG